jgi:hypothetical protein
MVLHLHVPKAFGIQMRVDFGGTDGLVTQKLLNGAKIRPALENMSRTTVSNHMRPYFFIERGLLGVLFDDLPHSLARGGAAPAIQKDTIAILEIETAIPLLAHFQISLA